MSDLSPQSSSLAAPSSVLDDSKSTIESKPAKPRLIDVLAAAEEDPDAFEIKIGKYGSVRLEDCMPRLVHERSIGMESAIVKAARVCYGAGIKKRSEDLALLKRLMRDGHTSPFEMIEFVFVIRCEIFTARQWFRHRLASYNEESARYSEIEDHYYKPDQLDVRAQSATNKQGSSETTDLCYDVRLDFASGVDLVTDMADRVYRKALQSGVAREQARAVLPMGTYTKFFYKTNARSLLNFLELRMDSHAQAEIRAYATAIHTLVKKVAPNLIYLFDTYVKGSMRLSALEIRALHEGVIPEEMSITEKKEWEAKKQKLALAVVNSSSASQ